MFCNFYKYNFKKGDIYKFIGKGGINMKNIINSLKTLNYKITHIHLVNDGVYITGTNIEDIEFCKEYLNDYFTTEGFININIPTNKLSCLIGYQGRNAKELTEYIYIYLGIKCYIHFQTNGVLIKASHGTNLIIVTNLLNNLLENYLYTSIL